LPLKGESLTGRIAFTLVGFVTCLHTALSNGYHVLAPAAGEELV
jgi:hypothetical protein